MDTAVFHFQYFIFNGDRNSYSYFICVLELLHRLMIFDGDGAHECRIYKDENI